MGQVIFFKKKPTSTNFTRSILEYFVPFDVISPSQAWPYLQWCSMFSEHPKKKTRSYSQGVIGKVNDLKFLTIPRRLPMVRCCLCKAAVLPLVSIRKVTPHSIFYKNIAELSKLSVFGTLNGDVFVGVLSTYIALTL